jgi:hypothetical protein
MTTSTRKISDIVNSNPYFPGMWSLLGVTALALLVLLVALGLVLSGIWPAGALVLASLPAALFGTICIIEFIWGVSLARKRQDFLESERPLVRWTYLPAEWATLLEADWKEARTGWKLPIGCLSFLLGLAGLMVGGAIAAAGASFSSLDWEKLLEITVGALAGALAGAAVGGLIGAIIAIGNRFAAQRSYRQTTPGEVALGLHEFSVAGQYVKFGDGWRSLKQMEWQSDQPTRLLITIDRWLPRRDEEIWEIVVPDRVLPQVELLVRQLERDIK